MEKNVTDREQDDREQEYLAYRGCLRWCGVLGLVILAVGLFYSFK